MGEFTRKSGEKLLLKLSLKDSADDKFVRAFLFDQSGTDLGFVNLAHSSDGIYQEEALTMPDVSQVVAKYFVYDDSDYTELAGYEDVIDTFDLDTGQSGGGSRVTMELVAEIEAPEINAVVESNIVDATKTVAELDSNVSDNETTGDLATGDVDSNLTTNEIDGELGC